MWPAIMALAAAVAMWGVQSTGKKKGGSGNVASFTGPPPGMSMQQWIQQRGYYRAALQPMAQQSGVSWESLIPVAFELLRGSGGKVVQGLPDKVGVWIANIGEMLGPIIDFYNRYIKDIVQDIYNVWKGIRDFYTDDLGPAIRALRQATDNTAVAIGTLPPFLQEPIQKAIGPYLGSLSNTLARFDLQAWNITGGLQTGFDNLRAAWSTAFQSYSQVYQRTMTAEYEKNRINYRAEEEKTRQLLTSIFQVSGDTIRYRSELQAEADIRKRIEEIDKEAAGGMPKLMKKLSGVWASLKLWIADAANQVVGTLEDIVAPFQPVSPYYAAANASTALATAVAFGATAHGLATAAELFHPFKTMGVHYMSAFVAQMAGFGIIVSQTVGQLARLAIGQPYRYRLNEQYRPFLPDVSTLQTLAVKPDIQIADFRQAMKYWGFRDEWIDAIERTMYREPRYFELSMMATDAAATREWLYRKARRAGYSEEDGEIFAESIVKKALSRERTDFMRSLLDLYAEGYISAEQFDEHISFLDLAPEAYQLLKKTAQFKYLLSYTDEMVKYVIEQYRNDVFSYEEALGALTGLAVESEKISILLNRERVKKEAKIAQKERKEIEAQINRHRSILLRKWLYMYRSGAIAKGALITFMIGAGFTPAYANIVADLEEQKKVYYERRRELRSKEALERRVKRTYERAYRTLYNRGKIDEETLKKYLFAIDYTPQEVSSIVTYERARKKKTRRVLPEADLERVRLETIEDYKQKLVDMLMSDTLSPQAFRSALLKLRVDEDEIEKLLSDSLNLKRDLSFKE